MPVSAGGLIYSADLNATRFVRTTADITKTSSTSYSDITGLAFTLAATSEYAMDGFVSYYCLDGVDCKFTWTGPAGMTVSWSLRGLVTSATTASGDIDCTSQENTTDELTVNTETASALAVHPFGYWKTGGTAGTLQMRFAQNVSNGTALQIKRGSWLRLVKIA